MKIVGISIWMASMIVICSANLTSAFTEDSETGWNNGYTDTNANGVLDLADTGASINGWLFRPAGLKDYALNGVVGRRLLEMPNVDPTSWHTAGKIHGEDVSGTTIELSFKIAMKGFSSTGIIWLSDTNQNGYGIRVDRKNNNEATIIKFSGSTRAFGSSLVTNWLDRSGEDWANSVVVGTQYNDEMTCHIRLEQVTAGAKVTMTLWITGSNTTAASYHNPSQMKVDDGSGTVFSAGVIDLANLTYVGITSSGSSNNNPRYMRLDDIVVTQAEDFETDWANGAIDTNGNSVLDLGDNGALHNGWIFRPAGLPGYSLEMDSISGNYFLDAPDVDPMSWHTGGTTHGVNMTSATAIEMSFKVAMKDFFSKGIVWLSDTNQNGYGIRVDRKNNNEAAIIKFSGSTRVFGSTQIANWLDANGEDASNAVVIAGQYDDYITCHIRLEQSVAGQPVTVKLWYTDSNYGDTSRDYPQQVKVDDGSGTVFSAGVINLTSLTYVGVTSSGSTNNNPRYIYIDDIIVNQVNVPLLTGVLTVSAGTNMTESGADDMAKIRDYYNSATSNQGINTTSWNWLNPLKTNGLRSINMEKGSGLVNGILVPSNNLMLTIDKTLERNLEIHLVVGQQAPTHLPANAGDWTAGDWDSYRTYAYELVKYVAATFDPDAGDPNNPTGFMKSMFEVENEKDRATEAWFIGGTGHPAGGTAMYNAYYELYKVWAGAVDQVANENPQRTVWIGGPSRGIQWGKQLVADTATDGVRLNFVSHHVYGESGPIAGRSWPVYTESTSPGRRIKMELRNALDDAGYINVPIIMTEWGPSSSSAIDNAGQINADYRGAAYAAAFMTNMVATTLDDAVPLLFSNTVSGGSENWFAIASLSGGGQYPKALYNVFEMFRRMPSQRVVCDSSQLAPHLRGALASADANTVGVVVYNYNWMDGNLNDTTSTQSVQIHVDNVPFAGTQAVVRQYLIDASHSDVYTLFIKPGLPIDETKVTLQQVAKYSVPVSNGSVDLTAVSMGPSATSLWLIDRNDTVAPTPDPATWTVLPSANGAVSVSMTATTASDDLLGVEYYFQCTSGGGHDSGWQVSSTYTDTGLTKLTQYSYRVKSRDTSANQNETLWSTTQWVTTANVSPWPDPATWDVLPQATSSTSISMTATAAFSVRLMENIETSLWAHNTEGNLGIGAGTHGWKMRSGEDYSLLTIGTNQQLNMPDIDPVSWHSGGKMHGLDPRGVTSMELSFRISATGFNSKGMVWLSDHYQNGYGIQVYRKSNNEAAIIKLSGSGKEFGSPDVTDWFNRNGEDGINTVGIGTQYNDYIICHIRLEQPAAGGNVTMTFWQTGSNIADTSYANPSQVKVDDGLGALFSAEVIDLANLTYVGMTSSGSSNDSPRYIRLDDIIVSLIDTASDPANVEYYFQCTAGGGSDSGWQIGATYEDTGLSSNVTYTYRVQVRDKSNLNTTNWSGTASATTP